MARIDLPDGQWADFHDRISHGEDNEIKKAVRRARADEQLWFEADDLILRSFLKDWYVKDRDGQPIAATDADAIARLPADVADTLTAAAALAYTGATVPNEPTPNS